MWHLWVNFPYWKLHFLLCYNCRFLAVQPRLYMSLQACDTRTPLNLDELAFTHSSYRGFGCDGTVGGNHHGSEWQKAHWGWNVVNIKACSITVRQNYNNTSRMGDCWGIDCAMRRVKKIVLSSTYKYYAPDSRQDVRVDRCLSFNLQRSQWSRYVRELLGTSVPPCQVTLCSASVLLILSLTFYRFTHFHYMTGSMHSTVFKDN